MSNVAKKRLVRKKIKRHFLCSIQKLASTQTFGTVFREKIRKVQNSINEHDLLKIFNCYIDVYGIVNSDDVIFSIKIF